MTACLALNMLQVVVLPLPVLFSVLSVYSLLSS